MARFLWERSLKVGISLTGTILGLNLDVKSFRFSQPMKRFGSGHWRQIFFMSSGNNVLFDGFGNFLSGIVPKARMRLT